MSLLDLKNEFLKNCDTSKIISKIYFNWNQQDKRGRTPLMYALEYKKGEGFYLNNEEWFSLIKKSDFNKINIKSKISIRDYILFYYKINFDYEQTNYLLEKCKDAKTVTSFPDSLLKLLTSEKLSSAECIDLSNKFNLINDKEIELAINGYVGLDNLLLNKIVKENINFENKWRNNWLDLLDEKYKYFKDICNILDETILFIINNKNYDNVENKELKNRIIKIKCETLSESLLDKIDSKKIDKIKKI